MPEGVRHLYFCQSHHKFSVWTDVFIGYVPSVIFPPCSVQAPPPAFQRAIIPSDIAGNGQATFCMDIGLMIEEMEAPSLKVGRSFRVKFIQERFFKSRVELFSVPDAIKHQTSA